MMYKKLLKVQTMLKAPKSNYNSFGKYNYRSAEQILEAVKPFEKEIGFVLLISDEIKDVAGRIYVEATASFIDTETGESASVKAYAREPEVKKGMDDSQITGTASSYARKYALNGLLLLDDTKDPDTDEHRRETEKRSSKSSGDGDDAKLKILRATIKKKGLEDASIEKYFKKKIDDLSITEIAKAMSMLQKYADKEDK